MERDTKRFGLNAVVRNLLLQLEGRGVCNCLEIFEDHLHAHQSRRKEEEPTTRSLGRSRSVAWCVPGGDERGRASARRQIHVTT